MIAYLKGRIIDKTSSGQLVLDVNGVGYEVEVSLQTFCRVEMQLDIVGLYIQTIVREDAFLLYGFYDKDERALFRSLIRVNGVGPKLAMTILSGMTPQEFLQTIQQKNAQYLVKIPGIGKKTAERLVVEMQDSVQLFSLLPEMILTPESHAQQEAINALESLGYRTQDAVKTIRTLDNGQKSCEQLIREGLQKLASI